MAGRSHSDGRTGSGYATLGVHGVGSDSQAEEVWPYASRTETEVEAMSTPDREQKSRKAIAKRNKKHFSSDRLQALNYKTGSFVNGATRGLTGIMSGVDPRDVLEAFIKTTIKRNIPRELNKPIGMSAPFSTMSSDATTRTRPGMTLGSKAGWFGAPPPKETDPSMSRRAYRLKDIADDEEEWPLQHVKIEKSRIMRKNRTYESIGPSLRSCVISGTENK